MTKTSLLIILLTAAITTSVVAAPIPNLTKDNYSVSAWFKTSQDGPIFAKTAPAGKWVAGGKTLFIESGQINFDVGWAGVFGGKTRVTDNKWHHVALTGSNPQKIYLDGKLEATDDLNLKPDPTGSIFKIGIVSTDFPVGGIGFRGEIDDVRIYSKKLSEKEIADISKGKSSSDNLIAHWPLDGKLDDVVGKSKALIPKENSFIEGKHAKALSLKGAIQAVAAKSNTRAQKPKSIEEAYFSSETASKITKQFGINKMLFVRRHTFTANHYYTEFINSEWKPGGNICVLDLKSGKITDLVPELKGGVFGRFDLNFDAKRIVFAWKSEHQKGNRLYEIEIDPNTGERKGELTQLTFPEKNEEEIVKLYRVSGEYHHGTDDMDPCYLPDGDIVFISTRCQYGILCDSPDNFTTTVLYRMKRKASLADRKASAHLTKLSNSALSEASPTILPDGRIMYTRWEYVDKGAVSVKCLWAMKPDGSGSVEIYGNDINLPPTMLYGRPIPGKTSQYVMLGTPHYPQNGMGTVIRLDMTKPIRTREPMTYMSPDVDIRAEQGFDFKVGNGWRRDHAGKPGRLFKEPYPLSDKLFLVPMKAAGPMWTDNKAYDLALLAENGEASVIYDDAEMSCFLPFPLQKRTKPPVSQSAINKTLAKQDMAACVVTDIYHGMENTERGSIKYIRVLEQIPRPWATRRRWGGDIYDQQHATITRNTHLGLKVQHGVVPVEEDGSAHFLVPARRNIFFQALDENYMAVQTERTFVNYMPGETRSCIGCHETPNAAATARTRGTVKALKRKASIPGPQPGEKSGKRAIDFVADVQPVLDKHCVKCHSGNEAKKGLRLSGEMTSLFNVAYEHLIEKRRGGPGRWHHNLLCGETIGENHPKTGNVHYMPARSFGSHSSALVALLSDVEIKLKNQKQAGFIENLLKNHKKPKLTKEELLKITNWIDTNGQFYGMYWGRKNIKYKDHPNFRPTPTFERAASYVSTIPEDQR